MGTQRSKEDEVHKISTSVFVTNFPDQYGAKDLWNSCKVYGHVVDAYIPNRKSNVGKRFGFVRFIKVSDVERLVNNICTVWVGRYKLHANVARFQREPLNKHNTHDMVSGVNRGNVGVGNNVKGAKGASNSYAHVVKGIQIPKGDSDNNPSLVLDDLCLNQTDYSLCLMAKVKDFASLSNLKVVLVNEGFLNIVIKYMGGFWVMIEFQSEGAKKSFQSNLSMGTWFSQIMQASHDFIIDERVTWVEIEGIPLKLWSWNTFSRIVSKWGDLLDGDDQEDGLVYRGKVFWGRAKEVPGWVPDFVDDNEEETDSDDGSYEGELNVGDLKIAADVEGDSDVELVPESKFEEEPNKPTLEEDLVGQNNAQYADPFGIYDILNKKRDANNKDPTSKDSLKYPPGFTPIDDKDASVAVSYDTFVKTREGDGQEDGFSGEKQKVSKNDVEESVCSGQFKKSEVPRTGGSILQLIDDLVKVGQTMGYDMKGCLAQKAKKDWVKELCVSNKVNFLSLQETKMESIELFCIMRLWDYLSLVISNWDGEVVIMGDFNEVRNKCERFGSVFNSQGADVFNAFISNAGLVEVPLGGCSFTWCHKSATKMSKLDRFVISDSLMCSCPNISSTSLDRYLSDHRLILMREVSYDYGPVPFRFFHYWFEIEGFDKLVEDSWKEAPVTDSNSYLKMMKKLRYLKDKIRVWSRLNKESSNRRKRSLKYELVDLDLIIDKGVGEDTDVNRRHEVVRLLQEVEKIESLEVAQKVKIKWAIEGDENSKFYHSVLNKKRGQLAIQNRLRMEMDFPNRINSDQKEDLGREISKEEIKRSVWDCATDKTPGPDGFTFGFYRRYWNLIKSDVVDAIACFFNQGQIPKGGNSSFIALIPKVPNANMVKDFRPISLIGSLYKNIAKILANRFVMVLGDLVNEIQSTFVANRQILDGPFILNELVQWCKKKKKQSMVFKVDFEKAYDSVRWDFVDDILKKFGFGEKWCRWIQSCLRSSRGSVIVNGSPTKEFQFYKGLKQGDPLSLFLFILVMESLHVSFQRVVDAGLFKGIVLAPSFHLSHMFYADDAIFMGQWSEYNIDTIVHVLDCFHRASGLRINMAKSKLMGISVDGVKVEQAAAKIGCVTLKTPFTYLGACVGGLMSRLQSWNEIVESMATRLSKWKLKTLSIGGRLTLLKSVLGAIPIYHMSIFKVPLTVLQRMESIRSKFFNGVEHHSKKPIWVKWKNALASKDKGGLGVSSLFALNRALMFKWVWRFIFQSSSLWVRVIKVLHGEDGKIGKKVNSTYSSLWLNIIHEVELLKQQGIDLTSYIHFKLGNGVNTSFWDVAWRGDIAFKVLYPRMYALESLKSINVVSKLSHSGLEFSFRRNPRGGAEQVRFDLLKEKVEGCVLVNMKDR
ncbi:RNA-directed DNA polymerase, eukaryota, reverse transcriptase zinc-binding domain protein [Tanacetum coccineum]